MCYAEWLMGALKRETRLAAGTPAVCRLGLATRGNTKLEVEDVQMAIDAGVNYLNWCGQPDGMSRAIAEMKADQRKEVVVAIQLAARTRSDAEQELGDALGSVYTLHRRGHILLR